MKLIRSTGVVFFLALLVPPPAGAVVRYFEDAASRAMAGARGFVAVRLDPDLMKSIVTGFPAGGPYLADWIDGELRDIQEAMGLDPRQKGTLIYSFDPEDPARRLLDIRIPYSVRDVTKKLAGRGKVTLFGKEFQVEEGSPLKLIGARDEIWLVEDGCLLVGPRAALEAHRTDERPDDARLKLVHRLETWTDGMWIMAHVPVSEALAGRWSGRVRNPAIPAGLVQHVRLVDGTVRGAETVLEIGFDEAGAAQAGVSVAQGLRDTLLGQVESGQVTIQKLLARLSSRSPDPAAQEPPVMARVKSWFQAIVIEASGVSLSVRIPVDSGNR